MKSGGMGLGILQHSACPTSIDRRNFAFCSSHFNLFNFLPLLRKPGPDPLIPGRSDAERGRLS